MSILLCVCLHFYVSFCLSVPVRAGGRVLFPIPVLMGVLTSGYVHVHMFVPKRVRVPTSVSVYVRGVSVCARVWVISCVHVCVIARMCTDAVYMPDCMHACIRACACLVVRACVCVCNDNKEETTSVFTSLS